MRTSSPRIILGAFLVGTFILLGPAAAFAQFVITGNASPSVAEGSSAVATYGTQNATGTVTWSKSGGSDQSKFSINASGALSFNTAPDAETPTDNGQDNVYNVTVQATDGTDTDTLAVTVTVTGVNEFMPVVTGSTNVEYAENDTATVATYTITDDDFGETVVVDLDSSSPFDDDFSIDANTGALTFTTPPDFESPADGDADNVYSTNVRADDGSNTVTLEVTVTVTDAPAVDGSLAIDYEENGAGTVETYTVSGPTVTWSLADTGDSDDLSIDANGDLAFITPPDFETAADGDSDNVYQVTVQAADGTEMGRRDVSVTVTNQNEAPVAADDTANTGVDTSVVISVLANDSDPDANTTLSVTAVNNVTGGATAVTDGTTVTYTPGDGFAGTGSFTYTVTDGDPATPLTDTGTVTVRVIDTSPPNNNSNLSRLTVSSGELTPAFKATTTSYTLDVGNAVSSVKVTATTEDPAANATVTVNGRAVTGGNVPLTEGEISTVRITVTAGDGSTTTYTIRVYRAASNDARLSMLTLSAGTLTPAFDEAKTEYTVEVGSAVSRMTVTPVTAHGGATVRVNGTQVASGSFSGGIPLTEGGTTTINVVVTAQDGTTTRTYVIAVTRAPLAPEVSGSLPPLTLDAGGAGERVDAGAAIEGKQLRWTFESSDPGVASVLGEGSVVVVTPGREGSVEVTATARNESGVASVAFAVSVRTSAAEEEAIRSALSGQARVLLGSVSEVIGERFRGVAGGAGNRCGESAGEAGGGSWIAGPGGSGSYDAGFGGRLGGMAPVDSRGDGRLRGDGPDLLSLAWGRSFSLALGGQAADCEEGAGNAARRWNLWGAADLQRARGGAGAADFDGEWRFLYLGVDRAFGERWAGGVSVSQGWGDSDYTFDDTASSGGGGLSSNLTGIYPYVHGEVMSGLRLWAVGGFGFGALENVRDHVDGHRDEGELQMGLAAAGVRKSLSQVGGVDLSLIGDAGFVSLSASGEGSLEGADASVGRLRLGLEMSRRFAGGAEPFAQLYGRHDSGDGPIGAAAEMVLGMRYAGARLNLEVRGNYLVSASDFEQWGGRARVGYAAGKDGSGLNGSLTTRWGARESGGSFLEGHAMQMTGPDLGRGWGESPSAEFSGEVGYGLSIRRLRDGSLRPTLGYDQRSSGAARARLGLAYLLFGNPERDFRLRLDTARTGRREIDPYHSIQLSAALRF